MYWTHLTRLCWIVLFLLFAIVIHIPGLLAQPKVCQSIDIRNDLVKFKLLENCSVIEGHLRITLMHTDNAANKANIADEFKKLSFPHLRQITDYLLLYRVTGLLTLSNIFPNLSVIRGQKLFYNYALVIFEMDSMEDVGLPSLTHILRGGVRLEKNPDLCYIQTIDWSKIVKSSVENAIFQNKIVDQCVNVCPTDHGIQRCAPKDDDLQTHLCWDSTSCQKLCPRECEQQKKSCYLKEDNWECCNEECVGGCNGPTSMDCFACKNVTYNGRCVINCPPNTVLFNEWRCINISDCKKIMVPFCHNGGLELEGSDSPYKVHNGRCLKECPSGFKPKENDPTQCKECDGPCPKECQGDVIDSIAKAQAFKGCTKIIGSLEITIRGGSQVAQELDDNLSMIQIVTHFVKITRAYPLISLSFLRNLKEITADKRFQDRYALWVLNNANLQDIWNMTTHPKLRIGNNATIFFNDNGKLCHDKIKELVNTLNVVVEDRDIPTVTNGHQIACNLSSIDVKIDVKPGNLVIVTWTPYATNDQRNLLYYILYYKEAPEQNVTVFDTRDACGYDSWNTREVNSVKDDKNHQPKFMTDVLVDILPATQYALYVQTYTVESTNRGAISPIHYFTSRPSQPSPPLDVHVNIKEANMMTVSWLPPRNPNGKVTYYMVVYTPVFVQQEKLEKRNYCLDQLRLSQLSDGGTTVEKDEKKKNLTGSTYFGDKGDEKCPCPCSEKKEEKVEADTRTDQINFEDYLHNIVFQKRSDKSTCPSSAYWPEYLYRRKRSEPVQDQGSGRQSRRSAPQGVDEDIFRTAMSTLLYESSGDLDIPSTKGVGNYSMNATEPVASYNGSYTEGQSIWKRTEETFVRLDDLKHFQEYKIEVVACHEREIELNDDPTVDRCSETAIANERTKAISSKDNINISTIVVTNHTATEVLISWADPEDPNGLIVSYELEYKKVGKTGSEANFKCIRHSTYRTNSGEKLDVSTAGNYTFRLRATSLAGNGTWTPYQFFYVAETTAGNANTEIAIAVAVCVCIVFMVLISCGVYFLARKGFNNGPNPQALITSINPEYISTGDVYIPDEWEVERCKVDIGKPLGQGSFGMVYAGIYRDEKKKLINVAIKTVKDNATIGDRVRFLNEASIMKAFRCTHVVRLIGVVSQGMPVMVIMELMALGDLKNFLRVHRPNEKENEGAKPPSLKQILQMAGEIADGMAYLAGNKYVHRDLAARNCMVAEDLKCKIGDFGMTRDIYETDYYRKGTKGLLPVRWMAPESIADGVFTSQSDVWSYGVVLWEMATLAAQPYQGLANEQVLKYVQEGHKMERPEGCPDRLYDLMIKCWQFNPKHRPTFNEIVLSLIPDLDETFKNYSYFFSEENQELFSDHLSDCGDQEMQLLTHRHSSLEDIDHYSHSSSINSHRSNSLDHEQDTSPTLSESHETTPCLQYRNKDRHSTESKSKPYSPTYSHNSSLADGDNARTRMTRTGGPNQLPTSLSKDSSLGNSLLPASSASGSGDSSKSSSGSHYHLNGLSANGHIPQVGFQC